MDADPSSLRPNPLGSHHPQAYSCTVKKTARSCAAFLKLRKRTAISIKNSPATDVCKSWWSSSIMGLSKDWREFLELLNPAALITAFNTKLSAIIDGSRFSFLVETHRLATSEQ